MPINLNDSINPAETRTNLNLIQTLNTFAFVLKRITGQSSWKVPPPLSLGELGAKGDTGAQGIQGVKGDKGDTGAQGIQGVKGDKGDTGAQGIQGLKGDTGAQGIQGLKGDTGAQGIQGLKGDKGDTGAQGIQGLKGDKGDFSSVHPGFASQQYYCYPFYATTGSISCSANFVYYSYFFVPSQTVFDKAAFFSNASFTASQNQKARVAIYRLSVNRPSTLLVDLGEIALTTTGIKEISCSVSLVPGWYALAISASPNTMTSQYASNNICNIFGQSNPSTGLFTGHRAVLTYGAFPANASLANITETTSPIIWLRAV